MALTNDELLILQSELTNDPLNRNYQTMSDQEEPGNDSSVTLLAHY